MAAKPAASRTTVSRWFMYEPSVEACSRGGHRRRPARKTDDQHEGCEPRQHIGIILRKLREEVISLHHRLRTPFRRIYRPPRGLEHSPAVWRTFARNVAIADYFVTIGTFAC